MSGRLIKPVSPWSALKTTPRRQPAACIRRVKPEIAACTPRSSRRTSASDPTRYAVLQYARGARTLNRIGVKSVFSASGDEQPDWKMRGLPVALDGMFASAQAGRAAARTPSELARRQARQVASHV